MTDLENVLKSFEVDQDCMEKNVKNIKNYLITKN